MLNVKIINICWEKIDYDQVQIQKLTSKKDFGIYQIYGYHPAYKEDSLLYIGKASSFSSRLSERFEFLESCSIPRTIRLGRITNSAQEDDICNWSFENRDSIVDIAEKILIKAHAPAFNKQDNTGLFEPDVNEFGGQHYVILNWDEFGSLLPEVSTLRFSFRFYMFEKPLGE
jgi:hypothetical protein